MGDSTDQGSLCVSGGDHPCLLADGAVPGATHHHWCITTAYGNFQAWGLPHMGLLCAGTIPRFSGRWIALSFATPSQSRILEGERTWAYFGRCVLAWLQLLGG